MRLLFRTIFVSCAVGGAAWGAVTSNTITYPLDTKGPERAVKTAAELSTLPLAMRRAGETVTLTDPEGTVTTLVDSSSAVSSVALPISAGGVWTVANSKQGTVKFTVRRSIDGTLGDGTAASPAKLVDGDELVDYSAGNGYVFTCDGTDSLFFELRLPSGASLEAAGDDAWRIVSSEGGVQYTWAEFAYLLDSAQDGPDRKVNPAALPVAYSGDNWVGASDKVSTVTFTPPEGSGLSSTVLNLRGTGVQTFRFGTAGVWTVRLVMANGKALEAMVTVRAGFVISFR